MDRKRELKEQYKQTRPRMGLFMVRSKASGKCFVEATQDLRSRLNSTKVKLNAAMHPNRELQEEWRERGEEDFTFEVLETLEYDQDATKTDYTDDLELLKALWLEKHGEGLVFYGKAQTLHIAR